MARRRVLWLALLGLPSVATYWCAFAWPYGQSQLVACGSEPGIALLTDRSPVACALYVGAVTLLFGLYLAAVRLASRLRGSSAHVVVHPTPLWAGGWRAGQASRGFAVSALGLSLGSRFSCPFGSIAARPADRCARANGPPAESTCCDLTRSCILTRARPTPIIAV